MLKSKYLSGKGSMSWSQAQKCWVRIEWILHFQAWALTQGFSRPRRDQQMTTLFKAVAGSPLTGGFFTKWDLVGGEHPPPPVDQKWRLLKIFFFFLSTDGIIGLMREHEQAWSQSRIWVPSHLFLPRLASWMYNLCSHTWPCAQQGLVLGLIV